MNHLKTLLSTIVVLSAASAAIAQDTDDPLLCPVNLEPVVAGGSVVETMGIRFEFCCPGCDLKLTEDPEGYLQKANEAGATVGVFVFDPVSQKRIDPENAQASADHNGVRYLFETTENLDEFSAFPELYAQIPPQESLFCPVMKSESETYSQASGYADHENVRYYFCCAGCDTKFAEDPAKFASHVKAHLRSSTGEPIQAKAGMQMAPTCAGCAGEARLLGPDGVPTEWTFAYRYVGIDDVKSRHRWTLDYMLTDNLSIGIERAGSDSRVGPTTSIDDGLFDWLRDSDGDATILPRATWFVTPDRENHPSLTVGFASDRLSTPRGQAFFATVGKSIPESPFTPFVSVKTNTFEGRTVFPFGVNYYMNDGWAIQAINDGDYSHVLLTKMLTSASVSLLYARTQYWGFSVAVGF